MPHSIFTGRVQRRGEPYFLPEDTDLAVALAEEEAETCRACGYPKAWCRDPKHQFAFEVVSEQCHVTYALTAASGAEPKEISKQAKQSSASFRPGFIPDTGAGLDLPEELDTID